MRVIQVLKETVAANQVLALNLCGNKEGDTVVGDVYLDIQDTMGVVTEGSVDGSNWYELKVIDMAKYQIKSGISDKGYYMIPASGLAKIRFTFDAAGDVVIKETF